MEYQLEKWKRQDWRKDSRHYSCEVRQNLFGQWVVLAMGAGECEAGAESGAGVRSLRTRVGNL